MTTMFPVATAADPRAPRASETTIEVDLIGRDPHALARILVTLQRRRCVVTHVDFRLADRHRPGSLTVTLLEPPRHGRTVEAWLVNLVDVAAVRRLHAA